MIAVRNLRKHYRVTKRPPGMVAALRSLFHRRYELVKAVDGVSFDIAKGERVALLGENGAGKTTTLKVLSGLLHPTSGTARVFDEDPARRARSSLRRISLVLGQRQRLLWDLPPQETFELNRLVYEVPEADFRATLRELDDLLELGDLPRRPTRELSLGDRMKCELAAALIHRPEILFLDEPTIGLDVGMQLAVRGFLERYGEQHGATILLTSHYMGDVVALCPRVIVMNHGTIQYDGALGELTHRTRPEKLVVLHLERSVDARDLVALGTLVAHRPLEVVLRVKPSELKAVLADALMRLPIRDLSVQDPPLEEIMAEIFAGRSDGRRAAPAEGES